MKMVCRNKLQNFTKWKAIFDSHRNAHVASGLKLENLWRGADDPNSVIYIFEVTNETKARAFISAPKAVEAAKESGVVDGDYWIVE
jgi:hypothetical protein